MVRRAVWHNGASSSTDTATISKIRNTRNLPPSRDKSIGNLIENQYKPKKVMDKMIRGDNVEQVGKRLWWMLQLFHRTHGAVGLAVLKSNGIDFTPKDFSNAPAGYDEAVIEEMEL